MRENGGPVKADWNAGGTQNAAKEAEEKNTGGAVKLRASGGAMKMRADKRARGGSVVAAKATGGSVITAKAKGGAVPGRARGGGIGADKKPLSSAATVKHVTKGETPEDGDDKVM